MLAFLVGLSASGEVLHLSDDNFTSEMEKSPVSFVLASRSDVSYCQELIPKFLQLASVLTDPVQLVILEHDLTPLTRQTYHLFAFPSIFVFRGTRMSAEYTGEREVLHMAAFLHRISGPPLTYLEAARDVHDFLEAHRVCVVLAGEDIDTDIMKTFQNVAAQLCDELSFGWAKTADAIVQLGLEEVPALQLHRSDDRQVVDFPLAFSVTEDMLIGWARDSMVPKYHMRDSVVFRNLAFDNRYTLIGFVDSSRKQSLDLMHQTFQKAVSEYGPNLTYVYCDIFDMGTVVLNLGFTGAREPVYLIASLSGGELQDRYLFPERRQPTPDNVVRWVGQFLNGTVKQKIRSEPEVNGQEGPLLKLVGTEFRTVVMSTEADIVTALLIGNEENRSQTMAILAEVAGEFAKQKVKSVKFYHIDTDLNELPGLRKGDWTEPIILLWPAGKEKNPLLFKGDITAFQLMDGLLTHCKSKVKFKVPAQYDEGSLEL
jgi:protein disulfide-isomerase A1